MRWRASCNLTRRRLVRAQCARRPLTTDNHLHSRALAGAGVEDCADRAADPQPSCRTHMGVYRDYRTGPGYQPPPVSPPPVVRPAAARRRPGAVGHRGADRGEPDDAGVHAVAGPRGAVVGRAAEDRLLPLRRVRGGRVATVPEHGSRVPDARRRRADLLQLLERDRVVAAPRRQLRGEGQRGRPRRVRHERRLQPVHVRHDHLLLLLPVRHVGLRSGGWWRHAGERHDVEQLLVDDVFERVVQGSARSAPPGPARAASPTRSRSARPPPAPTPCPARRPPLRRLVAARR